MFITRRQLVAATAACATLAGSGGVLAQLPAPAPGRRLLSAGELEAVAALVESFFPPGNPLAVGANRAESAAELDRLLADDLDKVVAPVFRHLLRGLEFGTLATHGAKFSQLELPIRMDLLNEWSEPGNVPRRLAYEVLKTCAGWAWLNAPAARAAIGWQSDCHAGAA